MCPTWNVAKFTYVQLHGKNVFAKVSKNLARQKFENNFVGLLNNYGAQVDC